MLFGCGWLMSEEPLESFSKLVSLVFSKSRKLHIVSGKEKVCLASCSSAEGEYNFLYF